MPKALLVLDMLNDFIHKGGALYCGEAAETIVPFIKSKIDDFRSNGNPVMYIQDSHDADDKEFQQFPKHCVGGTKGAEIIDELKTPDMVKIDKKTYDGFYNTSLGDVLQRGGIDEVHLVGVCTSICIMETASSLAKRGYAIVVYKDGVADLDDESHRFALKHMKSLYGATIV
jgi:nicotinamidase-related amidase